MNKNGENGLDFARKRRFDVFGVKFYSPKYSIYTMNRKAVYLYFTDMEA